MHLSCLPTPDQGEHTMSGREPEIQGCGSRLVMSPDDPRPTVHVCAEPAGHRGPHADSGSSWTALPATNWGEVISAAISEDPAEADVLRRARQQARLGFRSPREPTSPDDDYDWPTYIAESFEVVRRVVSSYVPLLSARVAERAVRELDAAAMLVRWDDHSGVAGEPEATPSKGSEIAAAVSPTQDPVTTPDQGSAVSTAGGVTVPDEAVRAFIAAYYRVECTAEVFYAADAVRAGLAAAAPLIAKSVIARLRGLAGEPELIVDMSQDRRERVDLISAMHLLDRAADWLERADELERGGDRD